MSENTLSTYDIARRLRVNITTVQNWIREGRLNAYRTPGGHRRVLDRDFRAFVEKYNIPVAGETEKLKILIADDEKDIRSAVRKVIERKYPDAEVFEAPDGFSAGLVLGRENIALLVLDIRMPGLDGFQVMDMIRKDSRMGEPGIIVITGYLEDELEERVKSKGGGRLLVKPFDISELRRALEEVLGVGG